MAMSFEDELEQDWQSYIIEDDMDEELYVTPEEKPKPKTPKPLATAVVPDEEYVEEELFERCV